MDNYGLRDVYADRGIHRQAIAASASGLLSMREAKGTSFSPRSRTIVSLIFLAFIAIGWAATSFVDTELER
jgi:hypothetical protein